MDAGLSSVSPEIFDLASQVLGIDAVELCATGSTAGADLSTTRWAQPAVLTCSVASFQIADRRGEAFAAFAGHSVGEFAALVAAGAITLPDALKLIARRAAACDEAHRINPGGMAAMMKVDREVVEQICADSGAALAADNSKGQLVVSGTYDVLDRALELAASTKAICKRLDVAAAFHSPAMEPAVEPLREALNEVEIVTPSREFWSTTTASQLSDPADIERSLIAQLTSPVRFRETAEGLAAKHGPSFVDLGPGRIVGAIAKRAVDGCEIRYAADLSEVAS